MRLLVVLVVAFVGLLIVLFGHAYGWGAALGQSIEDWNIAQLHQYHPYSDHPGLAEAKTWDWSTYLGRTAVATTLFLLLFVAAFIYATIKTISRGK